MGYDLHLSSFLNDNTLKPSTRKCNDTEYPTYDTVFQTTSRVTLVLRIHLPNRVDSEYGQQVPPEMHLLGVKANHPWMDQKLRIVGYPHINSTMAWNSSGLKLGQAVNAVIKHLQLNPPVIVQITDSHLRKLNPSVSENSKKGNRSLMYDNSVGEDEVTTKTSIKIPDVPQSFPEFENMSKEELTQTQEKIVAVVEEMPSVLALVKQRDSINNRNIRDAQNNLKKEKELSCLFSEITSQQNDLKDKVTKFEEMQAKKRLLCKQPDTQDIIRRLELVKRQAFDESEVLASSWEDGEIDTDQFLNSFVDQRTKYHIRAAKIERLKAIK